MHPVRFCVTLLVAALSSPALAQQPAAVEQPDPRGTELFWCEIQRNEHADVAMKNAAQAWRIQEENKKLKAEIEELKKSVKPAEPPKE